MSLSQSFQQKLLQKLSPQQIQLMKLLQVPTANLEERIKEELEENPALELDDTHDDDFNEDIKDEFDTSDEENFELDGSSDDYDNIDVSEYMHDDDGEIADYKLRDDNYPEFDDKKVLPIKNDIGFHEVLLSQLNMLELDKNQLIIAEQIIGSIDDDGYLRRATLSIVDDLAFKQNINTTEKEVEFIISQIQQFDPAGIGCRNLQECLKIQLVRKQQEGENFTVAIKIIDKYFEEFTKKHFEKIQRALNITEEELKNYIQQITKLNPRPGGIIGEINKAETYIIPDYFILNDNGNLDLTLNSKNAPELRISSDYKEMMQDYSRSAKNNKQQKEAVMFIKQKIDAAKWFIDAIQQRQQTLHATMFEIMQFQKAFFLTGDEATIRPMILKDIAEKTGYDISTISRVANSKFVQTEFGTFKLKFFFGEGIDTDSGEEVSTREVKNILTDFIDKEDKKQPLSDERLTELLQEKGYNIARRTVAKYREQLQLPVARLRKQM